MSLFLFSYGFVIQPYTSAPEEGFWYDVTERDRVRVFGQDIEGTVIIAHGDGTHSLYFQGRFVGYIENELDLESVLDIFGDIEIVSRNKQD